MNNNDNIFKKLVESSNHNSFGLYHLVLINHKGVTYQTHASMYNKDKEQFILSGGTFKGCEMTTKMEGIAPEIWANCQPFPRCF